MNQHLKALTLITIVVATLDQVSKWVAIHTLKGMGTFSYMGDTFRWVYAENSGAFLSLGAQLSPSIRFWVLGVLTGVFLVGLLYYVVYHERDKLNSIALTLVFSGGLSNLFDRLFREHGRVVDFMNVGIGSLRTGIFNIADMAIMAGVFLMLIRSQKTSKKT